MLFTRVVGHVCGLKRVKVKKKKKIIIRSHRRFRRNFRLSNQN